jgi:hypothetical protein
LFAAAAYIGLQLLRNNGLRYILFAEDFICSCCHNVCWQLELDWWVTGKFVCKICLLLLLLLRKNGLHLIK